ncbi:MAG: Flp pilus assembly complex ATPase component TadA [Comamonadaceae bacterium]|nr:Flp pilus assembly complex ATPase component TadA [Comamonadaceae bacterium]
MRRHNRSSRLHSTRLRSRSALTRPRPLRREDTDGHHPAAGLRRQEQGLRPAPVGRPAADDPRARRRAAHQRAAAGAQGRARHGVRHHERRAAQGATRRRCECDFSFEIPSLARFRVNAFNQNRGAGAVFRTIPSQGADAGGAQRAARSSPRLAMQAARHGAGAPARPARASRTTLAAMVNHVNENEYGHILTVEDPIEFVHESQEVPDQPARGRAAHAVASPTRCARALREDPDVILVGEMRDLETIRLALTARRDRPPGVRHAAHQSARQDHRPHRRRVPGGREGNGARDAVGVAGAR